MRKPGLFPSVITREGVDGNVRFFSPLLSPRQLLK